MAHRLPFLRTVAGRSGRKTARIADDTPFISRDILPNMRRTPKLVAGRRPDSRGFSALFRAYDVVGSL